MTPSCSLSPQRLCQAIWGVGVLIITAGCSARLDTEAIAQSIQADLNQQGDLPVEAVVCPQDIEPTPGQTFVCWGRLSETEFFPIDVTQMDELAENVEAADTIDWSISNSRGVLNLAQLELYFQDELTQTLKTAIGENGAPDLDIQLQIDCGGTYRVNRPGDRFTCSVEDGLVIDARRPEVIQVNLDSQGNLNWQEVRNLATPEELAEAESLGLAFEAAEDTEAAVEEHEEPLEEDASVEEDASESSAQAQFKINTSFFSPGRSKKS